MQPGRVGRDGFPQFRNAEVLGVESVAALQRLDAGLADEVRRHLVGFAEPECDDILFAHAGIGNFADFRGAQGLNSGTGRKGMHRKIIEERGKWKEERYFRMGRELKPRKVQTQHGGTENTEDTEKCERGTERVVAMVALAITVTMTIVTLP